LSERKGDVRVYQGPDKRAKIAKDCIILGDLFAITVDGCLIHVPTGRNIPPPSSGVLALDDRKFVKHLMDKAGDLWLTTLTMPWGVGISSLPPATAKKLRQSWESYPGD
jgi:hypothetical protein